MTPLRCYAGKLAESAGKKLSAGRIFAKVLAPNDNSSKHGIVIPVGVYSFFPELAIPDPTQNARDKIPVFDALLQKQREISHIYYQRYPERRITRISPLADEDCLRIVILLFATHTDGSYGYYLDFGSSETGGRFNCLFELAFGKDAEDASGNYIVRAIDEEFSPDEALNELLTKFDAVRDLGWIETMREGDTGIGFTFESLIGVKENNDKTADFRGIELKCKLLKGKGSSSKLNLFLQGPNWTDGDASIERLRKIGTADSNGLYACRSQITTKPNNRGLLLDVAREEDQVRLLKQAEALGFWTFELLNTRLKEKLSRGAFIKAKKETRDSKVYYNYQELIYCESPSIDRFVQLVDDRSLVFELLMSEDPPGKVRNRGYPWRLIRDEFLEQLFAFQVKLRSSEK